MVFVPQMLTGTTTGTERRGVVLLVVMALLALFAAVGLSFVFYADAEATAAQWFREANEGQFQAVADYPTDKLLNYFLAQLIYDCDDTSPEGTGSGLRGHALARNMYGYQSGAFNTSPFSGIGRAHFSQTLPTIGAQDDFNLINYTYYQSDGFVRDPERMGSRASYTAAQTAPFVASNPSYTFADQNNMFLASMDGNGNVLRPSFYRPWMTQSRYTRLQPDPTWNDPAYTKSLALDLDPGQVLFGNNYSGNVKNYPFGTKNDSFWMDLGFPVLTAPNGQKFKPLFAPLIIDLDGKLNVNVLGNIRGAGNVNASNHGLGLWEANLAKLLNAGDLLNLFNGGNGVKGRYGPDGAPGTLGSVLPALASSRYYSLVDSDGVVDSTLALTSKYLQPGNAGNPNPGYYAWPYFDTTAYGDGNAFERTNHPGIFNPLSPQGDDRIFEFKEMTELLNFGSAWLPTGLELKKLMPANLDGGGNTRRRLLSTTRSFDVGRPGATGWLRPTDPAWQKYEMPTGQTYPTGLASPFPSASFPGSPTPGEFGADWRGVSNLPPGSMIALNRLDLNRALTNYPAVDATSGQIDLSNAATKTAFDAAQSDRQTLARDIYNRLRWFTTGKDPSVFPTKNTDEWYALRWLAQLAVNIVDFRDSDDYITPFNWDTTGNTDEYWVYGTELPKLVLNESYVEVITDPADPLNTNKATMPYLVNFWVELLNPMKDDGAGTNTVRLQIPAAGSGSMVPSYKLTIAVPGTLFEEENTGRPTKGNTKLEVADFTPEIAPTTQPLAGVDVNVVLPANTNYAGTNGKNEGFYLLGSKYDFPSTAGASPTPPITTLRVKEQNIGTVKSAMTYTVPNTTNPTTLKYNLFLRRLACPYLPEQSNPANPNYNPYITVDYVQNVPARDGVNNDSAGVHTPTVIDQRVAVGRKQPYAAHSSQQANQTPDNDPAMAGDQANTNQPQHTFFRHNAKEAAAANATNSATFTQPFDWLVHLDRYVTSPVDIMQVSGYRPYELTQQFITGATAKYNHRAPWFDPAARIYRLFEYLEVQTSRISGVSTAGRIPGKININTMSDEEVLQALCDANAASSFSAADVSAIFTRLIASRNGGGPGNERPFKSLATGNIAAGDTQYPNGSGIDDTLFRVDPVDSTKRLFEINPGTSNPHVKLELMNKIFNNVTTRSNCFAVWLTVGFFEVTNDNVKPAKLGKEINRDQNRNIRHRMFALIDRSELRLFPTMSGSLTGKLSGATPGAQTMVCQMTNIDGPNNTRWNIQPGMMLEVDSGANAETVLVQTVAAGSFTATFQMAHAAGVSLNIICRGNPGPVSSGNPAVFPAGSTPTYDPQQDPTVGMNYWIID